MWNGIFSPLFPHCFPSPTFFYFPSFLQANAWYSGSNPGSPLINSKRCDFCYLVPIISSVWMGFPLGSLSSILRTHVHLFEIHLKCHLLCKAFLGYPKERNYFLFWLHSIISRILFVTLELPHSLDSRALHSILWLWQVSLPIVCPLLTCLETGFSCVLASGSLSRSWGSSQSGCCVLDIDSPL